MLKVSLIVPFWNVEPYFAECLDSLISQDMAEMEILLIDDLGQDGSRTIAEAYAKKDSRIRIITHEVNKGLGGGRNTGLREAKGEYIWFIDSDDTIESGAVARFYKAAKVNQLDVLMFKVIVFSDGNVPNFDIEAKNRQLNFVLNNLIMKKKIITLFNTTNELQNFVKNIKSNVSWSYLFERKFLLKNHLLFPEKIYHEDFLTIIWFCLAQKVACINKVGYYYRIRPGSIITNKSLNHLTQSYQNYSVAIKEIINFMTSHKDSELIYSIGLKLFFRALNYKAELIICTPTIKIDRQTLLNDFYSLFKALSLHSKPHNKHIIEEIMQQRGFSARLTKHFATILCHYPLNEKALTKTINHWLLKERVKAATPHQLLSLKRKIVKK